MDPGSELQTTNVRYGHYTYNPKKGSHNTTVPAFCTTEYFQPPPMEFGPTKTQFVRTTTRTRLLACGGCSLTVLNPFPDDTGLPFTTTVSTMATRTIHRVVCSSEPTKPVGSSPPIMCPTDEEITGYLIIPGVRDDGVWWELIVFMGS
ncbi:hypothetical protein HYFRA_00001094 [Hymenoscyphus fraxineus]|uniref:Uncharacterized protein n=1 Tax=Hymenoscyphus fraxineus TaxID=746836 RepID=A0A9N9KTD7_9HELO|nr:hypothetical protein HYFRA_00001094 [Hymenoscyphus fraxineus]